MILSSFLIDILLFWFSIRYTLWGKSSRQLIFFFLFYPTRSLFQSFFLMRKPEGYCWNYPGFPSLTVSYYSTSDFFYSGHVGAMMFCALENYYIGNVFMMWVALFAVVFESMILIVLRVHYSIDIFAGIMISHYYWIVSGWISQRVDKMIGVGID